MASAVSLSFARVYRAPDLIAQGLGAFGRSCSPMRGNRTLYVVALWIQ